MREIMFHNKNYLILITMFFVVSCSDNKPTQPSQENFNVELSEVSQGFISLSFKGQNIDYLDGLIEIKSIRLQKVDGDDVEVIKDLQLNVANLTSESYLINQSISIPTGLYTRALIVLSGEPIITYRDNDQLVEGKLISPTGAILGEETTTINLNSPFANAFIEVTDEKNAHLSLTLPLNSLLKPLKPTIEPTLSGPYLEDIEESSQQKSWFFELRNNFIIEGDNYDNIDTVVVHGQYNSATDQEIILNGFKNSAISAVITDQVLVYQEDQISSLSNIAVGDYTEIRGRYIKQQDDYRLVADNVTFYKNNNLFKGVVVASEVGSLTLLGNNIADGSMHKPNEEVNFTNANIKKTNLYSVVTQPYSVPETVIAQGPAILQAQSRSLALNDTEVETKLVESSDYRFVVSSVSTICAQESLISETTENETEVDAKSLLDTDILSLSHLKVDAVEIITVGNRFIEVKGRDAVVYLHIEESLVGEFPNCDTPEPFSDHLFEGEQFKPFIVEHNLYSANVDEYRLTEDEKVKKFTSKQEIVTALKPAEIADTKTFHFDYYTRMNWGDTGWNAGDTWGNFEPEPSLNVNEPIFRQLDDSFSNLDAEAFLASKVAGLKVSKGMDFHYGEQKMTCSYIPIKLPKETEEELTDTPTLLTVELVTEGNASEDIKNITTLNTIQGDNIEDVISPYDVPARGGSAIILTYQDLLLWLKAIQDQQDGEPVKIFEILMTADVSAAAESGINCGNIKPLEVHVRLVKGDTKLAKLREKMHQYNLISSGILMGALAGAAGVILGGLAIDAYINKDIVLLFARKEIDAGDLDALDKIVKLKRINTFLLESKLQDLAIEVSKNYKFTKDDGAIDQDAIDAFKQRFNQLKFPDDFFTITAEGGYDFVPGSDVSEKVKQKFADTAKFKADVKKSYNPFRNPIKIKPIVKPIPSVTSNKPRRY